MKEYIDLGYIGESYVILELAKRGIKCQKLNHIFDFDLLLSNNLKVEVKTSSIIIPKDHRRKGYVRKIWQFNNYKRIGNKRVIGRNRKCDFYVFVCFGENKKPKKYLIVPSIVIKNRLSITFPVERKMRTDNYEFSLDDFEGKWDLLTEKDNLTDNMQSNLKDYSEENK